jgi:competence protein ComEC
MDCQIVGIVVNDPEVGPKSQKIILKPQEIIIKNKKIIPQAGLIAVMADLKQSIGYGEQLKINGELVLPENFSSFDYQSYLAKDQIYAQMLWPKIQILGSGYGNWLYSKIIIFKQNCNQQLVRQFLGQGLSFLESLILGEKSLLDPELKEQFRIIGVSHIIAISGDHIVMLQEIFIFLLLAAGLWRKQAIWVSLVIVMVFIAMTGFQASAVRAGIMGAMYVIAQGFSRQSQSWKNLVLAASIMVAFNPFILKYDPGFQLSFLAVLGIIFLSPIIAQALKKVPEIGPLRLKTILTITLSAQIFTIPISIYHFGAISLISPIANILIVPMMPYLLFFTIVSIFSGMVWGTLGIIASIPAKTFVYFILKIAQTLSLFSQASINLAIDVKVVFAIYAFLSYIIFKYRQSHQFLNNF